MEALRWIDVAERTGHSFRVHADGAEHPMKLVGVQQLPHARREGGAFRLEFLGPGEPLLPQATYRIAGEQFDQEIFIVPISRDSQGTRYEAIFT